MAGLLDIFGGGGGGGLYGDLLNDDQKSALATRGLLAMAGAFAQAAQPRLSVPGPGLGATIGAAAAALGGSQDEAATSAINAMLRGTQAKKLQAEIEYAKQAGTGVDAITKAIAGLNTPGGGAAAPGMPAAGTGTSGYMAVSPSAGGDISDPLSLIEKYESGGRNIMQGVVPPGGGYNPSVGRVTGPSSAGGYWQIIDPTWRENAPKVGVDLAKYPTAISAPREVQKAVAQKLYDEQGFAPWAPYNPALAAAIRRGGGGAAPTAAAPAPAGGGLLNLPQVPNAARDYFGATAPAAADAPAPADVAPNRVGRFAGVAPGTPVNSRGFPYNPEITDPAVAARVAQSMAAIKQAQQSGVPWAAPRETSGSSTDPIMSVTSADQAGGGDAPGGMASGLLVPKGPLTQQGVPGLPALPAVDPAVAGPLSLQPAAPAAPAGPGLLAAPGAAAPAMPAAAPLPQVNPAYGNVLATIAAARAGALRANLPDFFAPFEAALKDNPIYQQQLEIARRSAAQPFEQAQTLFNKQVEIAGVGPIEAAKLPYALAQAYFKADQDIRAAGPIAAAQNFERIKADNAPKGIIITKGEDGRLKISIDPDAVKAVTEATVTAPDQAKADIARETTRQQQFGERQGNWRQVDVPGGGKVWVDGNGRLITGANGNPYQAEEDPAVQAGRKKVAEQFGQRTVDQLQSAEDAQFSLQNTEKVRPLVDKMIAGYGADTRLEFGRGLKAAGLSNGDGVVATQTYLINRLDQASRVAKRFGSGAGITERDVENAKQLVGGTAQLDKQTLLNILDMVDRADRRALELQHQGYDRLTGGGKTPVDPNLYKVPIPIYTADHVARLPAGTPVINPNGDRGTVVIDAKGNRSIEPERTR